MTDQEAPFDRLVGTWTGQSTLWLDPEGEGDTQPSNVRVSTVARGKALWVDYDWTVDDTSEEGSLLIERDPKQPGYRAAWVDSWHQDRAMMVLTGDDAEAVDVRGTYQVPGYPEWGWRIRLETDGERLRLLMWNISPEGNEARAVEGGYERAGAGAS